MTYIQYYRIDIRTLSVNIKFICTSFRNRQNSEPSASFSGLFRSEYKWIWYFYDCTQKTKLKIEQNDPTKNRCFLIYLLSKCEVFIDNSHFSWQSSVRCCLQKLQTTFHRILNMVLWSVGIQPWLLV